MSNLRDFYPIRNYSVSPKLTSTETATPANGPSLDVSNFSVFPLVNGTAESFVSGSDATVYFNVGSGKFNGQVITIYLANDIGDFPTGEVTVRYEGYSANDADTSTKTVDMVGDGKYSFRLVWVVTDPGTPYAGRYTLINKPYWALAS